MYNISTNVIVNSNKKTGRITMAYPAPLMDNETVYMIEYDGSNNSGMFKESELTVTA